MPRGRPKPFDVVAPLKRRLESSIPKEIGKENKILEMDRLLNVINHSFRRKDEIGRPMDKLYQYYSDRAYAASQLFLKLESELK